MYDRRKVLLGLAASLGGAPLAAKLSSASATDIVQAIAPDSTLKFYSAAQFQFVSILSDIIVPQTETPGALAVGVPAYLDAMMSSWASSSTQENHSQSLSLIADQLGKNFTKWNDARQMRAVERFDAKAYDGSLDWDLAQRYRAIKSMIANVYYASEPGATEELIYRHTPGRWDGDIPFSEVGRTWYA